MRGSLEGTPRAGSVPEPVEAWLPMPGPDLGAPPPSAEDRTPVRVWNWFGADKEARRGRLSFDPGRPQHWIAGLFVAGALALFAFSLVLQGVLLLRGDEPGAGGFSVPDILLGVLLLAVPPLVWVAAFYEQGRQAWRSRLHLRLGRPAVELGLGVAAAAAMLLSLLALGAVLQALGAEAENPVIEQLVPLLTWPLILLIAGAAAVGEEMFFRGFLQPRVGIVPTNLLFGVVHLGYGVVLQVAVPLALGFVFSLLVVWRRSLVPAMAAHFAFNFVVLALQKVAYEAGWL